MKPPLFLLALASLFLPVPEAAAEQPRRPNIVFILSDDHRADFLGVAGNPFIETPRLDRLAGEGARFVNAFAVSATCSPSRASFWTGRYPFAAGAPYITQQNNTFLETRTTFAELLHDAGYHTAFFGKWHLGRGEDPKRGFDYWAGWEHGVPFDQVFFVNGERVETEGFTDDALSEMTASHIREAAGGREPFFVYMGLRSPHRPFAYPERLEPVLEDAEIPKPATFGEDWRKSGRERRVLAGRLAIESFPMYRNYFRTWDRFIKSYYRSAQSIDESVGRVLDALERAGVADDTIVVYSSDHGYNLGDHGLVEKHFAYEETMRIPFILRWPGRVQAGVEPEGLVTNLDLAPTLLRAAGLAVPERMQGRVLGSLLASPESVPEDWREDFLFVYESRDGLIPGQVALRGERYKLVTYTDLNTVELYDLDKDPGETRSVADEPAYAEVLEEMRARLAGLKEETGYRPRPTRGTLTEAYVAHDLGPEAVAALSDFFGDHAFDPEADIPGLGPVEWKTVAAGPDGFFPVEPFRAAAGKSVVLAFPLALRVEEDPHVAIWVAPWPHLRMFWKGDAIWEYDPAERVAGNLANPPLDRTENTVLFSVEAIRRPFRIFVEAPKDTVEVPGLRPHGR